MKPKLIITKSFARRVLNSVKFARLKLILFDQITSLGADVVSNLVLIRQ